jgi:hypothetical protein
LAPAPSPDVKKWQVTSTPVAPVVTPTPSPAFSPRSDLDTLLELASPAVGRRP